MDGFKAFKYYTAVKLHFTNEKFNVFANRGKVRGTYQTFLNRNDHMLFEKLARQYNDKDFIQYCACNFMYGNKDVVYHTAEAEQNFKEYIRRKQSITRVFTQDTQKIIDSGARYEQSCYEMPDVLQLYIAGKITIETMSILNDIDHIVDLAKAHSTYALLFSDDLLRVEKSKGFVKYDTNKIMNIYNSFLEDVKGNANG